MKKVISIAATAACLMLSSSCASKLNIVPQNSIYEEQVIELIQKGGDTAINTIQSMLSPMPKYLNFWGINGTAASNPSMYSYQGLDWMRSLMGDDIVLGNGVQPNDLIAPYYTQDVTYRMAAGGANLAHWMGYAEAINMANKLIKYSNYLDPTLSDKAKQVYYKSDAYARVIRAFSYMSLMEEYTPAYAKMKNPEAENSGLSIYKTYDPVRKGEARSTAKDTWKFIKDDLDEAAKDLVSLGIGVTTSYSAGELEDIDLSVVNFLKARAGLLTEDWTYCINACKAIIESGKYDFIASANYGGRVINNGKVGTLDNIVVEPHTNAFVALSKNPECILGFKKNSTNDNASSNKYFFKLANVFGTYSVNTEGGSPARINTVLYKKMEDRDCRKAAFMSPTEKYNYEYFDGTKGVIWPSSNLKFAASVGLDDNGVASTTDKTKCQDLEYCKFRYSEVYLMYAEALHATSSPDALSKINELRAARGASKLIVLTKADLQLEWSMEMWGEGGREYYNAKRWGKDIVRTGKTGGNHWSFDGYTNANMTMPFPTREQEDNNEWKADTTNL